MPVCYNLPFAVALATAAAPTAYTLSLRNHDSLLAFKTLRSVLNCRELIDFGGIDRFGLSVNRFALFLVFADYQQTRVLVNVLADFARPLMSLTSIWPAANWAERELWDLLGIRFANHPDLRRLMSDYGFRGFALRKDFPVYGFKQTRYDELSNSVVYEPVSLAQDDRELRLVNPWLGYARPVRSVLSLPYGLYA